MISKWCVALALCLNSILLSEIYDCFPFWKEVDMLKIRLEELYEVVDHFVIVEANKTFTGHPKQLIFKENAHLFEKYKSKIIHIIVEDFPDVPPTDDGYWAREIHQHNASIRGLVNCKPDDIILLSDLDEIPRHSTIQKIKDFYADPKYTVLKKKYQRYGCHIAALKPFIVCLDLQNYSGQLNRIAPTRWPGPAKAVPYWVLGCLSVNDVHLLHQKHSDLAMIPDAGWHMNTMGNLNMVIEKWMCHNVALANSGVTDEEAMKRTYENFLEAHRPVPVDDTFPIEVRANLEYYRSIGLIADY